MPKGQILLISSHVNINIQIYILDADVKIRPVSPFYFSPQIWLDAILTQKNYLRQKFILKYVM